MTAVDVVPVSEWLSLGAQRPVVRCSGTGTGGRRCLVRLLVCGVESGVVRPVWRALEHVPGCDRARAWGDGPGAAGWWCIEGPDAGRGVGVGAATRDDLFIMQIFCADGGEKARA